MPFKVIKNSIFVLFISATSLSLLSACVPNPLKTVASKTAGEFLVRASLAAQDEMKLDTETGYYYGQCMRGKEKKALCHKLYQGMVKYAKTTQRFKDVTIAHLTDPSFFEKIEQDYEYVRFNTI
jgi:hypothetical protein